MSKADQEREWVFNHHEDMSNEVAAAGGPWAIAERLEALVDVQERIHARMLGLMGAPEPPPAPALTGEDIEMVGCALGELRIQGLKELASALECLIDRLSGAEPGGIPKEASGEG